MKISLNWLRDYVQLDASIDEISRAITFLGFEVESVLSTGAPRLENVVVGEILSRAKHPNADKLSVCTVDVGTAGGVKTIVCGAHNCDPGNRVLVALPGAVLPGNFEIRQSKIRGQASEGMMCSPDEIGMGTDHSGLLILDGGPAPGTPMNEALPPGDTVFDLEITPNRPDCLCHLGIARELAAWFKRELKYPEIIFQGDAGGPPEARADLLGAVRVDAPEDCPLYSATILTGVKVAPSPPWLQDRLRALGQRPINNIVDVSNYVMLEYGQPLHAFDARKLGGGQIIVRRAREGEKIVTLDDKERVLTGQMLVIADGEKPVVVAGVMGGQNSGVVPETTELVLEAAYFRRQSIRATSKRLGLSSDSSYRYERGVDPHTLPEAARRAIDLILQTAGGRVVGPLYQVGGDVPWQREIVISPEYVNSRLGFEIPAGDMKSALELLELPISREESAGYDGGVQWTVSIPSWRDDLDRPIDLVEEILRIHGTGQIPPAVVSSPGLIAEDDPVVLFSRRAVDYLVGHDFHECVNYTLRSSKEVRGWSSETAAAGSALENPFVEDQSHLRSSLIGGLLETLKLNQARGVTAARLAEAGRIFVEEGGQVWECAAVGFVVAEPVGERTWLRREPADFYTAKHHVAAIAGMAGVDFERQPLTGAGEGLRGWQAGHSAAAGGLEQGWIAHFGLLELPAIKAMGIEGRVHAGLFAILPEKISSGAERRRFRPFSIYPAALRDLAVVVDAPAPSEEVRQALLKSARAAVGGMFGMESVSVFDVYRGAGLPEGKKSLAFSLVFRAEDRTLTDDEVNAAFQKLQDDFVRATGWQVRK